MKLTYLYYTFIIFLSTCFSVFSQVKPDEKKPEPTKGAITEEIEVVRPYKPVLADASKIRRSPDLKNTKPFKPNLNYSIIDKRLELNSDLRQLQAQQLDQKPVEVLKNNYAKAGLGNLNTGLAEAYFNTGADEALQAGLYIKHLNQSGDLTQQKFSNQQAGVFGKSIQDNITLSADLGYDRFATYFYGFDPQNPNANTKPNSQRFNLLTLKGEMVKNFQENATSDFAVKGDSYMLKNSFDAKENAIAFSTFYNKVWNQFNIGLNGSVDITATKDVAMHFYNNILRANPYIKLQGKNYKLSLGINLVQEMGSNTRTNLFPSVTAEFPVVPGYATLFGGYTGDVLKSTLRNFTSQNPYLSQNIPIENATEKSNLYGGIKGNAGSGFGFTAMLYIKSTENMPLFTNSKTTFEAFDVIYDKGNSKTVGLTGELNLKTSETLNLTGGFAMNNYNMGTQAQAWYKPDFRLYSNARLSFKEKFIFDAEVVLNGSSNGLYYNFTTPVPQAQTVAIDSYFDLSAGAEYQLKEKIGIFLRANNLFGNQYQRYLYYPNLGLNILGGLNYSF
ncbi:MAG: TonB-dependent receptor [Pyrinomonadaceae bacterium]|nr:TonB-dependent receptor [Sphingobacteriaceae bacterium]